MLYSSQEILNMCFDTANNRLRLAPLSPGVVASCNLPSQDILNRILDGDTLHFNNPNTNIGNPHTYSVQEVLNLAFDGVSRLRGI